jgi:hypothetical protein
MVKESRRETTKHTGAPDFVWIRAYQYLASVNNWTADRTLRWKCPPTKRFGVTPVISALLSFHFYEPVYYLDIEEPTPYSNEKTGYWLGVAHNVGDALTYRIRTDDTQQVIQRSVARSRNDVEGVDKLNGNTLWQEAIQREMDQLREYQTFRIPTEKDDL